MVWAMFHGGRVVKKVSFLVADVKAKQPRGFRKAGYYAMLSFFYVSVEFSVVREEMVPDQPMMGQGMSLQTP